MNNCVYTDVGTSMITETQRELKLNHLSEMELQSHLEIRLH